MDRIVEVAFGRNLALDSEAIAQRGTIAAYSSDAEAEPRLPFWPLLFKNVTIRLVGSDDLPEEAERRAVEDIGVALAAGRGAAPAYRPVPAAGTHHGRARGGRGRSRRGAAWTSTSARGGPCKGPSPLGGRRAASASRAPVTGPRSAHRPALPLRPPAAVLCRAPAARRRASCTRG